ncbi:hypothetical protein SERLA73DRAFT_78471 [Serpula lacrymans var. lacrymans S7.3]|uniref:Uncharacterized protein n=2 Tax=Serpula lacrymans var. lacrymans TaxID=341189 RepID=F8QDB9_SERL3|nr:uncharacterized protein SERLADRAFT_411887 [Serpula lacrymans var. lacrymans S7.9]EGN93590.1 hypothetical protein SERLA73DRAFT_78471 [Serpula lacrymans var. lacrymans S7.3]EGO18962.1 hypothetical protein SERLADRAFT_411887 [Serpula lacrymans var. lacrymans S7.9]
MTPSTPKADENQPLNDILWNDVIKHNKKMIERAKSESLEHYLYGVLDDIFSRCLQEQNLELVTKFSIFRLFLCPQYRLSYTFDSEDISPDQESGSRVDASSGTESGDFPDSGSSQEASKSQDGRSEGTIKEDSEALVSVKKNYQIPDFAVIADNSGYRNRKSQVEFIPFLIEAKPFNPRKAKGKRQSINGALRTIMSQIVLQAKANFDTYPMQQHVHIFCVLGHRWKVLRFERAVLTQVVYMHDDSEYKPDNQRCCRVLWKKDIVSYSPRFYPLLNKEGNDIHEQLKLEIAVCLNQYKELKTQQKQVNAEADT